jgi:hypothetical protein
MALTKVIYSMISSAGTSIAERFEGIATDDAGTPDAVFRVNRTHVANTNPHSFRDQTVFSPTSNGFAMASFDSALVSGGTANLDHTIGFQARPTHSGSGTLQDLQGYGWYPTVNGPVTNTWGVEIRTPNGPGAIQNEYGIRIGNLIKGVNKYPIFIANNLGTNSIGAATNFNGEGVVSIGDTARLFLGDSGNGFKSVAYNHNQNTNTYHIADAIQSMYFGPSNITFRVAPSGAAGATPSFTDLIYIRKSGANIGALYPGADGTQNLGVSGQGWKEIFASNGTINTSDARVKTEVRDLTDSELAAAKQLAKEIGVFKFLNAVAKKGDAARSHIGMTVQRAIEIMQSHGLDAMTYGFICYDEWEDEYQDHPAIYEQVIVEPEQIEIAEDGQSRIVKDAVIGNGPVTQPAWREQKRVAGNTYGFRADQLMLFIARGFEARLSALESSI